MRGPSASAKKGRKGDDIDDSGINEGPGSEEREKKKEKRERESQEKDKAGKRHQMKDGYEKGEWTRGEESHQTTQCNGGLQSEQGISPHDLQRNAGPNGDSNGAKKAGGDGSGEAALGDLLLPLMLPPLNFTHRETYGQSTASIDLEWGPQFRFSPVPFILPTAGITSFLAAEPETKRNHLTNLASAPKLRSA